jgi:sigma-B regulation protein RsbU (phosphoserine phosphatase)
MKKIFSILFFTCFVCGGLGRAQTFSLQTGREPVTSLDGLWRFQTGDNPVWASPDFDDVQWPLLRSDESWVTQGYKAYGGYAWYRFTIQAPKKSPPDFGCGDIDTLYDKSGCSSGEAG